MDSQIQCVTAGDEEMSALAQEEIDELTKESRKLEDQLKILLLPKDPLDEKNIMLEVGNVFIG